MNNTIDQQPSSNIYEFQLNDLLDVLVSSWRLIVGFVVAMLFFGIVYVSIKTPVYKVDVLMQVEQKVRGVGALAELSEIFQEESPVTAEFEIIRSRMVLGSVVDNLKLNIIAKPVRFPLIGNMINRRNINGNGIAEPRFGMNSFAWGGESIRISSFLVPSEFEGREFTLVSGKNGKYELYKSDDTLISKGIVGKPLSLLLDDIRKISLLVSDLKSRPGTRFRIIKVSRLAAINRLKQFLKITELGKLSGILQMSLEGTNRESVTTVLNEIANIYLRQSVERKSAEAEKTLSFLQNQLPILKGKMELAEAALNNYRLKKGSVDLPLETRATLDKAVAIDAQLSEFKTEREDLIRLFTVEHPKIAALDAQISILVKEIAIVESKVKGLPGTQQEILRLTRNAEVNSTLYTSLMNSAQELKVVKAGAVGNVRIVDYAVKPIKPIKPNKGFVLALTFILGVLLGVGAAFIRKSLRGTVQDPNLIEAKLGLMVYATVPYSKKQQEISNGFSNSIGPSVLAVTDSEDIAIESLRSLRTSLYFAQLNTRNNIISITSPGSSAGKSFIAMNLSAVLACADKRVLIIDADLRKGHIHDYFNIQCKYGLSDFIVNSMEISQIVRTTEISNLDIIPVGYPPSNPSELLLHKKFASILEIVAENYDYVIIDCPPILAVTDAAIIGRLAGATILVIRDNQSPLGEIEQSIRQLKHAGVNLRGAVYNGMRVSAIRNQYRYGKYYGYTNTDVKKNMRNNSTA